MPYPGRVIRMGDADRPTLTAIAAALRARGYAAPTAPAVFGPPLASFVRLFQSHNVDSEGRPLLIDGQVGPLTWNALFGAPAAVVPSGGGIAVLALNEAIGEIGVREVPPGSNGGPRVDQYLESVGVGSGRFWCMAFVYFCYREAARHGGLANPFPRTAGCVAAWNRVKASSPARLVTRAQAIANPSVVKPGMVFIHDYGGGRGHTGFVESLSGAALRTVEGNADPLGGSNGLGVFRVNRRSVMDRSLTGFINF
ncbi:MAG: CHAP domain-containing protein [Allosphingosinicella sp.]